jgi:DoxX-like family
MRLNIILWVVQVLLAALYAFSGSAKFLLPDEQLTADFPLPILFVHFIGTCELLGVLGLTLPSLLRIKPWLTPLAASGLVIIMIGATVITTIAMGPGPAVLPFIVGCLDVFVAYGRWRLRPIAARRA